MYESSVPEYVSYRVLLTVLDKRPIYRLPAEERIYIVQLIQRLKILDMQLRRNGQYGRPSLGF